MSIKQKIKNIFRLRSTVGKEGFSLIELIVSISMVVIITSAAVQVARFSDTHTNLTLSIDEFRAALRLSQTYALSAANPDVSNPDMQHVCGYGVTASGSDYDVFYLHVTEAEYDLDPDACLSTNPATGLTVDIKSYTLPRGVSFSTGGTVFFKSPYGETTDSGGASATVGFVLENAGGSSKAISVSEYGLID